MTNSLALASAAGSSPDQSLQILILLTGLALLPALLMAVTPFLRIVVVMHFLRQALGTPTTPSNQVLIGLAIVLTASLMHPVASQVYEAGWVPFEKGELPRQEAWVRGSAPLRNYLLKSVREKDLQLMLEITKTPAPKNSNELGLSIVAPAYTLSELRSSFQMGAAVFLPFLVIDLVVASLTLSLGMVQLPPAMISAPLKLLLFVSVDGWNVVVGSLFRSFAS
jgi:flagellar biosynthetic protein FliP